NCQPQIQFGGGAPLQITIFIPFEQGLQFLGTIKFMIQNLCLPAVRNVENVDQTQPFCPQE
ncbi:MAG: hypothetical protein BWK78_07890, partial [Thiotrichaceae bacterium IS1]